MGHVCFIPDTKDFFIAYGDHPEWGTGHTVSLDAAQPWHSCRRHASGGAACVVCGQQALLSVSTHPASVCAYLCVQAADMAAFACYVPIPAGVGLGG
jgi:hypothetical protein